MSMSGSGDLATSQVAPEISCRAVSTVALFFERSYGRARLEQAFESLDSGLDLRFVTDPGNFVSFDFLTNFLDALTEASGDPDFPRKSGAFNATPGALGFAYYMLRAVGTPRLCYEQVISLGPTYNKIGRFEIEHSGKRNLRFTYTSSRPERNRRLCELRQGQFASFTTIWGLPPADVVEHACQMNGAPHCRYELSWHPTFKPVVIGVLGAAAGLLTGGALLNPALGIVPATAVGLSIGSSVALALAYRAQSRQKSELLDVQREGMVGSLADLRSKVEEITRLNATLEQKVDERTRELKEKSIELQKALSKQLELDRLKTQFFQNISHELRTPLTLILAPVDSLLEDDDDLDPLARGQLEVVRRSALRLLGLINSLLDLSRIDAGRQRLALDEVDPAMAVAQMVENAQGLARQRGIALRYEGPASLPLVPLDGDKLEKMVANLLSNALKFTHPELLGKRPAEVVVETRIEDERLVIIVRDSGVGIPEGELERIFDRFHQVDGSDQRIFGGTGIGLSLVKDLAEFHCGEIRVESQEDRGSTFTLSLPTLREVYPPARLDRRRAQVDVAVDRRSVVGRQKLSQLIANPGDLALADIAPQPAPAPVTGSDHPERPTVLVADDNRDMLTYLATILARDYRVLTAADGQEAFELAVEHTPHCVVSDVMMPRKDGNTLVADLKKHERTRSIPVILVTAKADIHSKVSGLEGGADDYLTKPFNFQELRARIRNLLQTKALERSLAEKNEFLAKVNFDLMLSKKEVFLQTIEAMAFALEAKDAYTHGHSRRVSILSEEVARGMALSELEIERVRISAVLHDIGKLGIPEEILRKEDRLSPEEQEIIRRHPEIGYRILESVRELSDVNRCILLHHEKFDGTGYPKGVRGLDIPLESRIIAVTDTYDAMTTDRPYRRGLHHDRAIEELRRFSGTQFDPDCVRAFLRLYEDRAPVFPPFPSVFSKAG